MVLESDRCVGGYGSAIQQQNYLTYQESAGRIQEGGYTNFSTTTPYSNYSQHQQSGWSTGNGYHGNGPHHHHANSHSHGHNGYGNGHNYGHGPNGMNYGYEQTTWTLKNADEN